MAKLQKGKSWNLPGTTRAIIFTLLFLSLLIGGGWIGSMLGLDIYLTTIFLAALTTLLAFSLRKLVDQESIGSMGWKWKGYETDFAVGNLIAIAILGAGTCLLLVMGAVEWAGVEWNSSAFFYSLLLMIVVAVYEELAFRGYIQHNLMESIHPVKAWAITAVIFAFFHGTNPNGSLLGTFNVFLAGLLLGVNYLYTRNLWFGIGLHFTWNFLQGPVLGYGVSGLSLPSVLSQNQQGAELWTGGKFGFEASLLNTLLCLTVTAVLFWVYGKQHNKKWLP